MNDQNLDSLRQMAAYYLSIAISTLFPKAKCLQAQATARGFYCDVHFNSPITEDQFKVIEERMKELMSQNMPISDMEMMSSNAADLLKHNGQDLRAVCLKTRDEPTVKILQIGPYYEIYNDKISIYTKAISAFKLTNQELYKTSLPGRRNLTISRIEGTAFFEKDALKNYLKKAELIKDQDHQILGKKLGFFDFKQGTLPEMWNFLPKGVDFKDALEDFAIAGYKKNSYKKVITSNFYKTKTAKYPEILFAEEDSYCLNANKSLNHAGIYSSSAKHINDLPCKFFEITSCFGSENEEKRGLFTAKSYSMDKSTFFCSREQLDEEVISSLQFIDKAVKIFGVEANWRLTCKSSLLQSPSKKWEEAKSSLIRAMNVCDIQYELDNEPKNYFGPAVEVYFIDVWGQKWLGSFISIDVYHPNKLALSYQDVDGQTKISEMVTQSFLGSIERFMALLIEKNKGIIPLFVAESIN